MPEVNSAFSDPLSVGSAKRGLEPRHLDVASEPSAHVLECASSRRRGNRKLARISGNPGKTITINHFQINNSWYLVDLPGYGYAKRSKTERQKWEKMIRQYILGRQNLLTLFVLVDLRIEPQKIDLEFMEWLGVSQIPFVIAFTKSDKLKKSQVTASHKKYEEVLLNDWEALPVQFITSSNSGEGRAALLDYIEKTNKVFY